MSFLTGLSNVAQGVPQGVQSFQQIQQRAQQIQQAQQALDTAKKQTAADAAAFSGIGMDGGVGGQPGPYPAGLPGAQAPQGQDVQPMAPGQPSMPSQPPQGGGMTPQQGSQSAAPPAGGMTAPPPQQGGGGSLPGQQQPQGPGGIDPTSPQAAVQTVMSIAKEIKTRNPNIDPQTLMLATSRIIDMSKGIAPQLRQGAQVVIQQMKDATSGANTDKRVGATDRATEARSSDTDKRVGAQRDIAAGHDATSLQRVQQQGEQAMARTQASIAGANQRAASGQWSREKVSAYTERVKAVTTKLRVAQQQLSSLQNAGVGADDPRAQKAAGDVQKATQELDRVDAAAKVQPPSAAPAASGGGAAEPTHMLRGKPIHVQDGKWVFEDGSEAK